MGRLSKKLKILYAVLDWGIGHATRSLPVLRELVRGHEVTVMSSGRSLELIKKELPDIEFIDFPDYSVRYSKEGRNLILYMMLQMPKFLCRIRKEHIFTEKLVSELRFDRIISDNRYGVYSKNVRSYFITHQIRFKLPGLMSKLEVFSEMFNRMCFRNFANVFIPDEKYSPNLSGDLSHRSGISEDPKIIFTGILSDIERVEYEIISDYLFIISGPEPQRTIFEKKIFEQAASLNGKKIIVRGVTESDEIMNENGTEIYSSVKREKLAAMIRGARIIISRSGYSSVMEFVSCGKKALLVPTPGQTEQEYLADHYKKMKYFNYVDQNKMELRRDLEDVKGFEAPRLGANKISGMINVIVS